MKSEQIIIDLIDRHTLAVDQCFPIDDRERAMLAIDQLHREGRVSRLSITHKLGHSNLRLGG